MNIAIKREQSGTCAGSAEREQFGTKFKKITTHFLRTAGLSLAAATVALCGMTACTNDDNITGEEPANEQPAAEVKTYTVSIPASFEGDAQTRAVTFDGDGTTSTTTFASTEKVYVYNATKAAMLGSYLQPTNISADGKHCDLTGTLTGTIDNGDNLTLLYNLNDYQSDPDYCNFEYREQNGTQAGVIDGAKAVDVIVDNLSGGVLTTTATASFQNVQSMFRFKFVDESSNAINVKSILIGSKNSALAAINYPLRPASTQYTVTDITATLASATTDYIYVALCIKESVSNGDELNFTVRDNDGHFYEGTKAAPSGGFKNGKYYYNTSAIQLTKNDKITPTLTGSSATPDAYYRYTINENNVTISGKSRGYKFYFWGSDRVITINNLDAYYEGSDQIFYFASTSTTSTLNIVGTNNITCSGWNICIRSGGPLKLNGNGTLTVKIGNSPAGYTSPAKICGLYGTNYTNSNNLNETTTEVDVTSLLAADGYTVTRSARTDNADGTYTWTYTVTPTE